MAHQDVGHGPTLTLTEATLLGDGHVIARGFATCPPGEDWGLGYHLYEDPEARSRETGMAAVSGPVVPVVCDGQPHLWEARSQDAYGGGVVTEGTKAWGGKMQSPSSGDWLHKDVGHNGVAPVLASSSSAPSLRSPSSWLPWAAITLAGVAILATLAVRGYLEKKRK
jgi:hypothetical protein